MLPVREENRWLRPERSASIAVVEWSRSRTTRPGTAHLKTAGIRCATRSTQPGREGPNPSPSSLGSDVVPDVVPLLGWLDDATLLLLLLWGWEKCLPGEVLAALDKAE